VHQVDGVAVWYRADRHHRSEDGSMVCTNVVTVIPACGLSTTLDRTGRVSCEFWGIFRIGTRVRSEDEKTLHAVALILPTSNHSH
jgi:hypothetical protein